MSKAQQYINTQFSSVIAGKLMFHEPVSIPVDYTRGEFGEILDFTQGVVSPGCYDILLDDGCYEDFSDTPEAFRLFICLKCKEGDKDWESNAILRLDESVFFPKSQECFADVLRISSKDQHKVALESMSPFIRQSSHSWFVLVDRSSKLLRQIASELPNFSLRLKGEEYRQDFNDLPPQFSTNEYHEVSYHPNDKPLLEDGFVGFCGDETLDVIASKIQGPDKRVILPLICEDFGAIVLSKSAAQCKAGKEGQFELLLASESEALDVQEHLPNGDIVLAEKRISNLNYKPLLAKEEVLQYIEAGWKIEAANGLWKIPMFQPSAMKVVNLDREIPGFRTPKFQTKK